MYPAVHHGDPYSLAEASGYGGIVQSQFRSYVFLITSHWKDPIRHVCSPFLVCSLARPQ